MCPWMVLFLVLQKAVVLVMIQALMFSTDRRGDTSLALVI